MKKNLIQEKSFQFSLMMIEIYKQMLSQKEFIISKQIFRSATSIGANIAEAQGGISKRDFKNKISISLKEALETRYWMQLLDSSNFVQIDLKKANEALEVIINMLYKILKTTSLTLIKEKSYSIDGPVIGID
jgi:four helix bundle protein